MFAIVSLFTGANAHGRLTVPATRNPVGYENDPVPSNTDLSFVCRNGVSTPSLTVKAGDQLATTWTLTAAHVGDCAFYISYDWNLSNDKMKFFKIANKFDCKAYNHQEVMITLPEWLPAGRAVLRWDWYALHVFPTIEFYTQCVDLMITAAANPVPLSSIKTYSPINPPIYPAMGDHDVSTSKFRDPHNQYKPQFMTGPNCALGYTGNNCALTAKGTQGWIDVGDDSVTPISPSTPTPTTGPNPPSPTPQPTTPAPTTPTPPSPTAGPGPAPSTGACEVHAVAEGDTLYTISQNYEGVTWEQICEINSLENCSALSPGEQLLIPCNNCGTFTRSREMRQDGSSWVAVSNIRCTPTGQTYGLGGNEQGHLLKTLRSTGKAHSHAKHNRRAKRNRHKRMKDSF